MGEAFVDLELVLASKKEILNLTPQDKNILLSCRSNAVRNFTAGALAGGTAAWAASWKLRKAFRIYLSAGAAASFGMWMFDRSMFSCAEQIVKLDGSILQKELANMFSPKLSEASQLGFGSLSGVQVVTKYQNFPELMQLISKHFYTERIFDDSTSNNPKLRWRHRNFFSDHDSDSYDRTQGGCHSDSYNNSQGESENVNDSRRTNLETKHIFIKADPDTMAELDPLDFLFGYGAPVEEIHHPNTPNKPSGTHNRRYRRTHRKHRMRNYDDLSNSKHAAGV